MIRTITPDIQTQEIAATTSFNGIKLTEATGYAISSSVAVTTPSGKTFTAAVTDICTATAHGFKTGLKGQTSTTTTLPSGLSAATDYFVIVIDANTFKLATSLSNAQAGTAIDITSTGTGTHTFTATALAGASVKLQALVGSVWADIDGSSYDITASADYVWNVGTPYYSDVKAVYTLTAGQISVVQTTLVKVTI